MPRGEHGRFVAVLGWNLVIVIVQVCLGYIFSSRGG
jgi:hypothetical protein